MIQGNAVADETETPPPFRVVLARYGAVPQVARFGMSEALFDTVESELSHGAEIAVQSDRGVELAQLLEVVSEGINPEEKPVTDDVLRLATADDRKRHSENRRAADLEFFEWQNRIAEWQLQLQIIDTEQTLDGEQKILYVLDGQCL